MYFVQHCFLCPSDSTVSEDAAIEPRTIRLDLIPLYLCLPFILFFNFPPHPLIPPFTPFFLSSPYTPSPSPTCRGHSARDFRISFVEISQILGNVINYAERGRLRGKSSTLAAQIFHFSSVLFHKCVFPFT